MRIIPVLDLKGGLIVRGIAGKRDLYKPIESRLCSSARPAEVAASLRNLLGPGPMYLADLDAIAGEAPALEVCVELEGLGFELMIDAGIRSAASARQLAVELDGDLIAALETLPAPALLAELVAELGAGRLIFSLDLADGRPLAPGDDWPSEADEIAREAVSAGVERLILLDLKAVGTGEGPAHLDRCAAFKESYAGLELVTGGGVRDLDDLLALRSAGVDGVLVASALHDGRLGSEELQGLLEA
jgi:phosphoribosylformimino-5-aminoimidazole carboxamide ribotide isomerase